MIRFFLCVLGVLLAVPGLALIALAFKVPITISGMGYLAAYFLVVAGLLIAPWNKKYYIFILVGVIAIGFVVATRLFLARQYRRASNLRMMTLPQGKGERWISYLIDEQDAIIFGETLFHFIGGDSAIEHENLDSALAAAYAEIRVTYKVFPSPIVSTYLNLQQPTAFDAIVIEPQTDRHPEVAVIFLHGYMGNVTAQCWEIAKAVGRYGAMTVCPSTDWTGAWWQPRGKAILDATFAYAREQGIEKFYLGGFSNGGFGISRLAPELKNEKGLSGLIFIDGIADGSSIRETGLPVLIIQGTEDERVPVGGVRQIAESIGDLATYVEIDSDHFLIMKKPAFVQNAILSWLENQEANQ